MSDSESCGSGEHASAVRKLDSGAVRRLRENFEPASSSQDLALPTVRRSARQAAASQASEEARHAKTAEKRSLHAATKEVPAADATTLQALLARVVALEAGQQQLKADLQQSKVALQQTTTELDQTKSDLAVAQTELATTRTEVVELKASVTANLQNQAGSSTAAADHVKNQLQQQLNAESTTLEYLNQRVRSNSIVMLGVPDTAANSRPADLEALVKKELDSAAPSRAARPLSGCITAVRRIGKPNADSDTGRRAVVVEFATSAAKHQAFQRSAQLRSRGIRLSDELTQKQLQAQRHLEADAAALKSKGFHPFFRKGQLRFMDSGRLRTCKRGEATQVAPCPPGAGQSRPPAPPGRPRHHQRRSRQATPAGRASPRPNGAATSGLGSDPAIAAAQHIMAAAAAATTGSQLPPPPPPPPPGGTAGATSAPASPQ